MKSPPAVAIPDIPAVGKPRPLRLPPYQERSLGNGLRVLAVRRPTVPRVEMRLRVQAGSAYERGDGSLSRLLAETLTGGTRRLSSFDIASTLQAMGGSLSCSADADDILVAGGVLADHMRPFLGLLGEVLTEASYPDAEVAVAAERVAQEIVIGLSQPQMVAAEAVRAAFFRRHPYGRRLPRPRAVRRARAQDVRALHRSRLSPRGSTLVLVGDLQPARALDAVEEALAGWKGSKAPQLEAPPQKPVRKTLLVDRPGSVQTTIRMGGPALPRAHEQYPALTLANMVFGGYFASRLVSNIRESKGYTYSPGSAFEHRRRASMVVVGADVGAEVTAPALVEIRYELSRIAAAPPDQDELDQAKRYVAGITSLSTQTQAGLASTLDTLLAAGLPPEHLPETTTRIGRVSRDDAHAAAAAHLTPKHLLTVLVGDAATVARAVETVDDVVTSRR